VTKINDWISSPLKINCGNLQVCPLSALIFVIAVEILACRIRQDENLKGIQIKHPNFSRDRYINSHSKESKAFEKSRKRIAPSTLNLSAFVGTVKAVR
jgi:hypothetical protein